MGVFNTMSEEVIFNFKDKSLNAKDFFLNDLIKSDYCCIPQKNNRKIDLFDYHWDYTEYTVQADVLTNELSIFINYLDSWGRSTGRQEIEIDSGGNLIGRNNDFYPKIMEKIKSCKVSEQNWKDFVSEESLQDFINKQFKTPPSYVHKVKRVIPRQCYDFDAYYFVMKNTTIFLAKTINGWRGFYGFGYRFNLMEMENLINLENDIIDYFCYISESTEVLHHCNYRKLTENDIAYVAEVMPKEHPLSRPDEKSLANTEHCDWDAYYLKEDCWISCSDFPNVDEIRERITAVTAFSMEYE